MIFGVNRTADIQSITHCNLAHLSYQNFQKIQEYSPDLLYSLRDKALEYCDEWTNFKVVLLKQVDYLLNGKEPYPENFYKQIQFYMEE